MTLLANQRLAVVTLALSALLPGATAFAAPSEAEQAAYAVETRQSALHLMGFYMGPMGAMARGNIPVDLDVIGNNAGRIASLAPMLSEVFAKDTRAYDVKTDALDGIWDNWDDFTSKADAAVEQAATLAAMANAGTEEGIREAIGALGKTCGSCHDDYKQDD